MLRIPTGRLKREWSLLAIFGRANRSYRDISNTWLGHGFLSSNPTCPATQSGLSNSKSCSQIPYGAFSATPHDGQGLVIIVPSTLPAMITGHASAHEAHSED
jgi:hypothetical protein